MLDEVLINKNKTQNIIKTATAEEADRAMAVVLMGFSTDPAARWMYPNVADYLTHFPKFIKFLAGKAFENESAFCTEDFSGAALWLPPDVHPEDEPLIKLFEETVPEEKLDDMFAVFEQMGDFHPEEPHWYLPMIGVDTFRQSKGIGSALMKYALDICDREQKAAYLESSNPRNIPLYERHGFEVAGTIQVGSSPPVTPMVRKARK